MLHLIQLNEIREYEYFVAPLNISVHMNKTDK